MQDVEETTPSPQPATDRGRFPPVDHPHPRARRAVLALADGTEFEGYAFGADRSAAGEAVFATGMVGYPESLTDPSYRGQILAFTYPLIGNYGVPPRRIEDGLPPGFESERIQASGLVVGTLSSDFSHWSSTRSLAEWLEEEGVPGVSGIDVRALTRRLREHGTMPGRIVRDGEEAAPPFRDPADRNLVAEVSVDSPRLHPAPGGRGRRVILVDCGAKASIVRSLLSRGVDVLRVPWDHPLEEEEGDAFLVSNGPGDPRRAEATVGQLRRLLAGSRPVLGICLGNQLLARAAGAETYKLEFGHRGQNQPCLEVGTRRCWITSQNHGYAVDAARLPEGWEEWFRNANDGTNEGIRHRELPIRSVQFHPEANPGPRDAAGIFDRFLEMVG